MEIYFNEFKNNYNKINQLLRNNYIDNEEIGNLLTENNRIVWHN